MGVWDDVRFAGRLLLKERWFTAVAAVALALGIGVNTAVFTLVNAILIRGLPFDQPDRIVSLGTIDGRGRQLGMSKLDLEDWRTASRTLKNIGMFLGAPMNLSEEGLAPEQFTGTYTSANLFELIGQRPVLGRSLRPEDDRPQADPVAVIGDAIWRNRYGADPGIVGRVIKVNSLFCTVIAVMPPGMRFPFNSDIWIPFSMLPPEARDPKRDVRNVTGIGRLADGTTLEQTRAELVNVSGRLALEYPATNKDIRASIMSFNERVTGPQLRLIFLSLMGAVGFVLLIACANVANLLLARSTRRSREIAVRVSLGASRWRIVRQLLIESLLLSALGGLLGLGLALVGVRMFDAVVTTEMGKPYWMTFTMDGIVFLFLVAVCVATGVIFGLAPALHISRTEANEVLKDAGGRSGTGGLRARRWTSALNVVEIVLTLVLLAAAGFMMRSFLALYRADVGMDTSHLLTMRLFLPLTKYPQSEPRAALAGRIEERLRGVTAIQASALTTNPPLLGGFLRQLAVDGRESPPDRRPEVTMVGITADYFSTLGIRPVRGRVFDHTDGTPGHDSAVVNQRFVAMHFPGEDPLERQITLIDGSPAVQQSGPRVVKIVGVVPSIRQRNFQEPDPDPVVYLPYAADPQRNITLIVRAPGEPGQVAALVREEMRAIEPDIPLFGVLTMDQTLAQQRWPFRVF
jgi:predicted permease